MGYVEEGGPSSDRQVDEATVAGAVHWGRYDDRDLRCTEPDQGREVRLMLFQSPILDTTEERGTVLRRG